MTVIFEGLSVGPARLAISRVAGDERIKDFRMPESKPRLRGGEGRESPAFSNVRIFDGTSDTLSAPSNVLVRGNLIGTSNAEILEMVTNRRKRREQRKKDLQGLADSPARVERKHSMTGSNGLILCDLCYLLFKFISAFRLILTLPNSMIVACLCHEVPH
jgi:hypothetical protein